MPTRDAQKGYKDTHSDWVAYNKICALMLKGGPLTISDDRDTVLAHIWSTVRAVIATESNLMKPLLMFLGVTNEGIYPIFHNFTSLDILCGAFIEYHPRTFSY